MLTPRYISFPFLLSPLKMRWFFVAVYEGELFPWAVRRVEINVHETRMNMHKNVHEHGWSTDRQPVTSTLSRWNDTNAASHTYVKWPYLKIPEKSRTAPLSPLSISNSSSLHFPVFSVHPQQSTCSSITHSQLHTFALPEFSKYFGLLGLFLHFMNAAFPLIRIYIQHLYVATCAR